MVKVLNNYLVALLPDIYLGSMSMVFSIHKQHRNFAIP